MKKIKEIAITAAKWILSLVVFIAAGIVIMTIVGLIPGMTVGNPVRSGGMTGFSAWATMLALQWLGKSKHNPYI